MRIPRKDIAGFAKDLVDQCSSSRNERVQRGAMYRNLYLTGDENGVPQTYNKSFAHIENLSSFLYSPVELRFDVEFYGSPSPGDRAKAQTATSTLQSYIRRSNLDTEIETAVTWSLVKGKTFVKLLWGDDSFDPYLTQPELMGVLDESKNSLERQEAFFHSTFYTRTKFAELIVNHPDRDDIMRRVKSYSNIMKSSDRPDADNNIKQIILGGLNPYRASSDRSAGAQTQKGVVDWLSGPSPNLSPETLQSLIRLDELWVWDDARDDYTTIQIVGDDIVLEGKDRHRNIFADAFDPDNDIKKLKEYEGNPLSGHHPFIEFCPNILDGYFWGRSELCNVAVVQKSINTRIDGINSIMRRQEDPPRLLRGSQGISQQQFSKLRKPGGYLVDSSPNSQIQTLAPEMPANIFDSLHEFENMFNDMGGFAPVLQGRGESGVRAQGHAETLTRNAAPRFKNRALIVERQIESAGGLAFDLLKAKVATMQTAWVMPNDDSIESSLPPKNDLETPPIKGMKRIDFLLSQMPKNCKIVVDSHSSSPAFSHDTRELLFDLFKAGAVSPRQVVAHTNPPGQEEIMEDLQRKEIEQAEFAEKHPEAFAKAQGKKGK